MKLLLLGIDGMDPGIFERLAADDRMPHFKRLSETGVYRHMTVTIPPQSPTSWTSMATGVNPGEHGVFDFIIRDKGSYDPVLSLVRQKAGMFSRYIAPYDNDTLFDTYEKEGKEVYSIRWPLTFPSKRITEKHSIPGLGTPDVNGTLGVGTLVTTNPAWKDRETKTRKVIVEPSDLSKFDFPGLTQKTVKGIADVTVAASIAERDGSVALNLGGTKVPLSPHRWSDIFTVTFKMGMMMKVSCIARAILKETSPHTTVYITPLQINPRDTHHAYASPAKFGGKLSDETGPYMTLGMAEDTNALNDGCIDTDDFIQLCELIFDERKKMFFHCWDRLNDGIAACVFDTLDRIQHMCWRDHQDIIERWYGKCDALLGEVLERCEFSQQNHKLMVVSDHGFGAMDHVVHMNTWLMEQGYLNLASEDVGRTLDMKDVDWNRTKAFALGLNCIYINQRGREVQGIVDENDKRALCDAIAAQLMQFTDGHGNQVVSRVYRGYDVYAGSRHAAPDLVVGYNKGYRGSQETGLGKIPRRPSLEANTQSWSGDHCCDRDQVPGVFFSLNHSGDIAENISVTDIRHYAEQFLRKE